MRIRDGYNAAIYEALAAQRQWLKDHPGIRGAEAQVRIIAEGAGYDTLGGTFALTSYSFQGSRNKTRTYTNLAAALIAWRSLNADAKRLWHTSETGKRRLVIG